MMPAEIKAKIVPEYKVAPPDLAIIALTGLPELALGWCCWKVIPRPGEAKPAKVPFKSVTGALNISQPASWLSFAQASNLYQSGGFAGVGLLISSSPKGGLEDGIVGLDLDECLDRDTGEVLRGRESIVKDFVTVGGYIEVSPSGTGLRQFVRGNRLDEYKQFSKLVRLEVYDEADIRYLTVTGRPYPIGSKAGEIIAGQKPLENFIRKWCDKEPEPGALYLGEFGAIAESRTVEEVLALLRQNNKRGKVTRLLAGDPTDYAGNSEADAGLCWEIAYYTRSAAVIEAVMRGSGLIRDKWSSKRGKITLLQHTIRSVLKKQTKFYDVDQAEKVATKVIEKAADTAQKAVADSVLVGGCEDLRRGKGWKTDIYSITELLIRDRRLLGTIYYDQFSNFPTLSLSMRDAFKDDTAPDTVGRLSDVHYRCVARWLGRSWGINVKMEQTLAIVDAWSRKVSRNPLVERLNELHTLWDKKPRLENWLIDYLKAQLITDEGTDITEYLQTVGPRWVISVVARAMKPGRKADCMLVLEGKQGARKSSAVRVLAEALGGEYFREGFSLGAGKDSLIALRGRSIIEWGELSGLGKRDLNDIKNFLSQKTDSYRSVYGMTETDWPRTAVFAGTTNESRYLSDPSGGRRFWPVKVGRIDIDRLRDNGDQLWGEAVSLFRAGARWWLDESDAKDQRVIRLAAGEQNSRLSHNVWQELAADIADRLVGSELTLLDGGGKANCTHRFSGAQMRIWLGGGAEGAGRFEGNLWLPMTGGLKMAGWESRKIGGVMCWGISPERLDEICLNLGVAKPKRNGKAC